MSELRSKNFFIGVSVLDEVLFQNFSKSTNKNPIIATLETIRDSGVLHPGVVVYPLHSLGIIGGGILQSYTQASVNFFIPKINIIVSPQTNSFKKSIDLINSAANQLGIKRKLPLDLIEHWHRSRLLKWIENNPLLVARIHSFPGSYYENQHFIINRLKTATTSLLMLNSFQKFTSTREGFLFSSSRTNNWETLDIRHYLLLYPKPYTRSLTGDCTPMNLNKATLAELSEVPAELDPKFWGRRTKISNEIIQMLLNIESGYYKYNYSRYRTGNHARIYRKMFKSIEFFRRSYRKKDDKGEAILNIAVAFEILLTDNFARGITGKIINRAKRLLKGTRGFRLFSTSVEELFKCRGEYVHTGFLVNPLSIETCQVAYIFTLLNFSKLLHNIPLRKKEPISHILPLY